MLGIGRDDAVPDQLAKGALPIGKPIFCVGSQRTDFDKGIRGILQRAFKVITRLSAIELIAFITRSLGHYDSVLAEAGGGDVRNNMLRTAWRGLVVLLF